MVLYCIEHVPSTFCESRTSANSFDSQYTQTLKVPGLALGVWQQKHLEPYTLDYKAPPPPAIVCLANCQAPPCTPPHPTSHQLLIEHLQFAGARCWTQALKEKKKKPNLSKARQLKEGAPGAFCHSDISNMQIEWLSNPREQKNTL